jgi:serine/threonine protein kinase
VKCIDLTKIKGKYHYIAQKIISLKRINHPNIVKLYDIFQQEKKLYIVMEHVEGIKLFDYIHQKDSLTEYEASDIVKQLLDSVNYMQSLKNMS